MLALEKKTKIIFFSIDIKGVLVNVSIILKKYINNFLGVYLDNLSEKYITFKFYFFCKHLIN
jgi:hypothetical protein